MNNIFSGYSSDSDTERDERTLSVGEHPSIDQTIFSSEVRQIPGDSSTFPQKASKRSLEDIHKEESDSRKRLKEKRKQKKQKDVSSGETKSALPSVNSLLNMSQVTKHIDRKELHHNRVRQYEHQVGFFPIHLFLPLHPILAIHIVDEEKVKQSSGSESDTHTLPVFSSDQLNMMLDLFSTNPTRANESTNPQYNQHFFPREIRISRSCDWIDELSTSNPSSIQKLTTLGLETIMNTNSALRSQFQSQGITLDSFIPHLIPTHFPQLSAPPEKVVKKSKEVSVPDLHISLSLPFSISHDKISPFLDSLSKEVEQFRLSIKKSSFHLKQLQLQMEQIEFYRNDDATRLFAAFGFSPPPVSTSTQDLGSAELRNSENMAGNYPALSLLDSLTKQLNSLVRKYGGPEYYLCPRFHTSFASAVIKHTKHTSQRSRIKRNDDGTVLTPIPIDHNQTGECSYTLPYLVCKIGKKYHSFKLFDEAISKLDFIE